MPTLRLAYASQFLIAVMAVFTLWAQVGGQNHLDLMPWWIKLGLGAGTAFAVVKATIASVSREPAWNSGTLKWFGITLALLVGCGLTSYYFHVYGEDDEQDEEDTQTSSLVERGALTPWGLPAVWIALPGSQRPASRR
jgi:hypothetical protein